MFIFIYIYTHTYILIDTCSYLDVNTSLALGYYFLDEAQIFKNYVFYKSLWVNVYGIMARVLGFVPTK